MKKALFLSMALMLVASSAFAQAGGTIELVDKFSGLCYINAPSSGFSMISVIHGGIGGASGSEFALDYSEVPGVTYVFTTTLLGTAVGDLSHGAGYKANYGGCIPGPSITFAEFGIMGSWDPCSWIRFTIHPASQGLVAYDCADTEQVACGAGIALGGDETCVSCLHGGLPLTCPGAVPVLDETWGAIKNLYQ